MSTMGPDMNLAGDERGMVLPLVMLGTLILGALVTGLLTVGAVEVQVASNHLRATQAHFLAEAGLEDAFNYFRANPGEVDSAPGNLAPLTALAGPGENLSGSGTYSVRH